MLCSHIRLGAFVSLVKAFFLGHVSFCSCYCDALVWNDVCIHCSEASKQKHRGLKFATGSGQRAAVRTGGLAETAKKGLRGCQSTPDNNSKDTQQETYRVCKLVWTIYCALQRFKVFKNIFLTKCVRVGISGGAGSGAGTALEGRAGREEAYWSGERTANTDRRGERTPEPGPAHDWEVKSFHVIFYFSKRERGTV